MQVLDSPPAAPEAAVVGVAAPLGRDAALISDRLRSAGLPAQPCPDLAALSDGLASERFGAVVLTTECLTSPLAAQPLREVLRDQPPWSDVPVLLLSAPATPAFGAARLLGYLGGRPSVSLLERPISARMLVATVRLALLARARQLDVRRMLDELERANARLETRVEERTREVRRLAADLTIAEQAERRRIAHLLHDDLQQRLHGLSISLALANQAVAAQDADRATLMVAQSRKTLEGAASLTRSLSHELAPPLLSGGGLAELLEWTAAHARERFGLEVDVQIDDGVSIEQEDLRILLSQILGELLFNVAKHAGVDRATVGARQLPGALLRLVVEDGGAGFETSRVGAGLGLSTVGERLALVGGRLAVDSAPGAGTRVTLDLPSPEPADVPTGASG